MDNILIVTVIHISSIFIIAIRILLLLFKSSILIFKVWKMESEGLEIEPFPEVLLAYLPFYESHWEQDPMPPDPEPPQ